MQQSFTLHGLESFNVFSIYTTKMMLLYELADKLQRPQEFTQEFLCQHIRITKKYFLTIVPPCSCSYKFLPPICLHFSSFTHVQPAITLHPKDWNYCETICPLNSTIQKLPRNLAQKIGNGNVHQCTVLQKSLLPKCMQAHLPVRKGTAVSWVQPKFGNGDSDEAGV